MNIETDLEWAEEPEVEQSRLQRFRSLLNRTEGVYLEVLRAAALLIATGLLIWIAWLLISSTYNIAQDADAVQEEPVVVTATDVADIDIETADADSTDAAGEEGEDAVQSAFDKFRDDYFALYQKSFEKFRHEEDEALSKEQFTTKYLGDFEQSSANDELGMEAFVTAEEYPGLLSTMRDAAALPLTIERLQTYKSTPKVEVSERVRRTRTERYCTYFSSYFNECYSYSTRSVPYTETVTRRESPKGVLGPQTLFGAYQDNYLATLYSRREDSSNDARRERMERLEANEKGWLGLSSAVWFAGVFLAIMFFFLLVAIERHQRRIAATID